MKRNTSRKHVTGSRIRRKATKTDIAPVALKTGKSSDQAFIPAVVEGDSNEAVISVEVNRNGEATHRRAATIPVKVKQVKAGSRLHRRKALPFETTLVKSVDTQPRWSDPITDTVIAGTYIAQGAITSFRQLATTALDVASSLLQTRKTAAFSPSE